MKLQITKISFILLIVSFFTSCDAVKRVKTNEYLLTKNTVIVDDKEVKEELITNLIYQKPNTKFLRVPFSLYIYNLAKEYPDSTYQKWLEKKTNRKKRLNQLLSKKQTGELGSSYIGFNNWIKKTGEAPVIIDTIKARKSKKRLETYYKRLGWFNAKASYKITPKENKRASISYTINRFKPYFIDSIIKQISSPIVDSIYESTKSKNLIKKGKQYDRNDLKNERDRMTILLRNAGLYHFNQDYIGFEADTFNTGHKANIFYIIEDRKINTLDSTYTEPFEIYTINKVRIVTDFSIKNNNKPFKDSARYNKYELYSYDKLRFKPKAITDAISITPGTTFNDIDRTLTLNQLGELRMFKYPIIDYIEDLQDSTGTGLIASIILTPRKKYSFHVDFDAFTSSIQQYGVGFSSSLLIRNVFRGAEILEISARGSLGSSKDAADSESRFFNISEVGGDVKLSFPRILLPFNTDKIIPKYMSPFTSFSIGANGQQNVGLDRQSANVIFNYNWKSSKAVTNQFDLINVEYVRNLNTTNYFVVYQNSYNQLNDIARSIELQEPNSINPDYYTVDDTGNINLTIPDGTTNFINDVENNNISAGSRDEIETVKSINERKERLSEDNLIFASSFTWAKDTRQSINDNNFYRLRFKVEAAGNLLSLISNLASIQKNEDGNYKTFGVIHSQYIKFETDYIKHWSITNSTVLAVRAFGGIAIPYGNSNNIPFTRSYFAGGANDNRGWRAYDLGPGSSGGLNEFNEANFKLAFNAEYRFTILGSFKGAVFTDIGNIWNAFDNVNDDASKFNSFKDLEELAVATGMGLRYDFGFAVFRFDVGFKTYNPARTVGDRWLKEFNFSNSVFNIGINYPF